MFYTVFETQFWKIVLVGDETGLTNLHMETGEGSRTFSIHQEWERNDALFIEARKQIEAYFRGERTEFDIPINPEGTEFQLKAWQALRQIPFGEVRTYKQQAEAVGCPNGARAVGMANSRNPLPIIVPCHRVVGSNGTLTGFAHGVDAKRTLIEFEKGVVAGGGKHDCRDVRSVANGRA